MQERVNADARHGVRAFGAVWRFARGHLPTLCLILCVLGICAALGLGVRSGLRKRAEYEACQAACATDCFGVHEAIGDHCTCDTRAVVPGCEVSR